MVKVALVTLTLLIGVSSHAMAKRWVESYFVSNVGTDCFKIYVVIYSTDEEGTNWVDWAGFAYLGSGCARVVSQPGNELTENYNGDFFYSKDPNGPSIATVFESSEAYNAYLEERARYLEGHMSQRPGNAATMSEKLLPALILSPNPSHTGVFKTNIPVTGKITNMEGQLISQFENETTIDLSGLPVGIYFVAPIGYQVQRIVRQ